MILATNRGNAIVRETPMLFHFTVQDISEFA